MDSIKVVTSMMCRVGFVTPMERGFDPVPL